jgi:peroxiredoxin
MKRYLFPLFIVIFAASAFAMSSAPASETPSNFTLNDLSGKPVSLDSFKGKKTVLVTFFTTWCPSCQDEMPQLEALSKKNASRDLQVLGVGIRETKDGLTSFKNEYGVTFPILMDEKGRVATSFGVKYIPNMFIFDKSGKQVFHANYMRADELQKVLDKLLK